MVAQTCGPSSQRDTYHVAGQQEEGKETKDSLKLLEKKSTNDMSTSLLTNCHHEYRRTWFSN